MHDGLAPVEKVISLSTTSRGSLLLLLLLLLLPVDTASQTLSFGHAAGLPVHLFCDAKEKIFQKFGRKGEHNLVIGNQSLKIRDSNSCCCFSVTIQGYYSHLPLKLTAAA